MTDGALAGLRVIDAATLAAGPLIATWLGEHGAEVIKVEQPDGGDPLRQWGAQRDEVGLMWKSVARNKKCVTLNLRLEAGRDLLRSLTRQADVVIVNLRPSTLRKWDLEYATLAAANPKLVMVHVTGYGAGGPKSDWPGFGTLGEAMSGFAHLTGTPDGPPTLPSFMLADGVAALTATYAVMMALYHRDTHGGTGRSTGGDGAGSGRGQLIDINLIEPLARLLEQSVLTYDQLGTIPVRTGNRWDISAPRNTYKTSDGRWLAMSGSAPTIAMRALRAVGRPDLTADPKFAEAQQRLRNAAEIDAIMADWIGQRTLDAALAVFEEAGVAAAPIYDAEQLLDDPQLRARGVYQSVPDPDLGSMRVQAPVPRFSATPGRVSHLGPRLGEHNAEVYREFLGLDAEGLRELSEQGVILVAAKPRPRRSELATPASNDEMFAKAAASGADLVFLDLEDACAPAEREKARGKAARALRDLDWGRTARAIRMNGIDTHWAYGDVIEVVSTAREALDVIIVPKVRRARDVWWVDVLLTQLEETLGLRKRIALEVLIEETEGLQHVDEIAAASDRLEAIIFGAGDFSASQGARVDTNFEPLVDIPGDIWHYARARILVAARTAGIDAIDAPFPNYRDPGAYRVACERAAAMGFLGKWAIHPSQVEIANTAFSPTADEIAHAERLVAAYRAAESAGKGASGLDGMLVDAAHLRHAATVAARAGLLGLSGKDLPA